jgi:hypothetical protein
MSSVGAIWYANVRSRSYGLEPGHWFFHTGIWAVCGSAYKGVNGDWYVDLYTGKLGKPVPVLHPSFTRLSLAIAWVEAYFEMEVTRVSPRHLPTAEEL